MSNPTLKILPVLMVAVAATFVMQPMRASFVDSLVITENSSTSLSAMLTTSSGTTSLSVNSIGSEIWNIALTGIGGTSSFITGMGWTEPGAADLVNFVSFDPELPNVLTVGSDLTEGPPAVGLPDGTPDTTTFTLNGNPLSVTFHDLGDAASGVPDTGTTASLFGLSLVGLGFLRRKLC